MSFEYIRNAYGIDAKEGSRITYLDEYEGTIVGVNGQYFEIQLDGDDGSALYHPTYKLKVHEGEWRCFHCSELFTTTKEARQHFGHDESFEPACIIKSDIGLLEALRRAQYDALQAWQLVHTENSEIIDAWRDMDSRLKQSIEKIKLQEYNRGVRDVVVNAREKGIELEELLDLS